MGIESGSDVWAQVYERYERVGFDLEALNQPEQFALLAMLLDEQVTSGGFEQFYASCPRDGAQRAHAAVKAMTSTHIASVVAKANAVFSEGGPASELEERMSQLEALSDEEHEVLGRLDEEFFTSKEDLEDLSLIYYQAQPEAFLGPPPEEAAAVVWASLVAETVEDEGGLEDQAPEIATFFNAFDTIFSLRKMGIARYLMNLGWFGETAAGRVDALRVAGAAACADLVAEAHAAFPEGAPPSDQDKIVAQLEAMGEDKLSRLADIETELRGMSAEAVLQVHAWAAPHAALFAALQAED
jgi:hypothetical protein